MIEVGPEVVYTAHPDVNRDHLRASGRLYQHPPQPPDVLAEGAAVTDVDRVALPPLDGGRHVGPAHGRLDHLLHVHHREAVAGDGVAAQDEVEVVAFGDALGEGAAGAGHHAHVLLNLPADAVDFFEVRPVDLDADRRADAGGEHVEASLDRHGPTIGEADLLLPQRLIHFGG